MAKERIARGKFSKKIHVDWPKNSRARLYGNIYRCYNQHVNPDCQPKVAITGAQSNKRVLVWNAVYLRMLKLYPIISASRAANRVAYNSYEDINGRDGRVLLAVLGLEVLSKEEKGGDHELCHSWQSSAGEYHICWYVKPITHEDKQRAFDPNTCEFIIIPAFVDDTHIFCNTLHVIKQHVKMNPNSPIFTQR